MKKKFKKDFNYIDWDGFYHYGKPFNSFSKWSPPSTIEMVSPENIFNERWEDNSFIDEIMGRPKRLVKVIK